MKKKSSLFLLLAILLVTNLTSYTMGRSLSGRNSAVLSKNGELDNEQKRRLLFLENYINENYLRDVDQQELYTGQLKGMVSALDDPYSEYLTEIEFNELMEDTSGKFFGIGVYINSQDGFVTVVAPIRNTPAEKSGLLPKDRILKVDGVELSGDDASEASKLIRGKRGTPVTLTVMRMENEKPKTFDIDVMRDEITVVTVESEVIKDNILYISISQFNENTHKEFVEATKKIDRNVKGIILDLRSNPGGLMDVCADIADMLLPEGLIYYTEIKGGVRSDEGYSDKAMIDLPLVTLINGGTASASEIVSGALKDYGRTILIGEKTFGKGVVQSINRFSTKDGIKLTISEYFTPKGNTVHKVGIEPDIEIKLNDPTLIIGLENIDKDNQLQRAIEELNKKF